MQLLYSLSFHFFESALIHFHMHGANEEHLSEHRESNRFLCSLILTDLGRNLPCAAPQLGVPLLPPVPVLAAASQLPPASARHWLALLPNPQLSALAWLPSAVA